MLATINLAALAAFGLGLANASPITKRVPSFTVNDTQILQYACQSITPSGIEESLLTFPLRFHSDC